MRYKVNEVKQSGGNKVCACANHKLQSLHNGMTPMHCAASGGHLEVCSLLLERCEDPNSSDVRGWTPLHEAAQEEVCRLILERCEEKNPLNVSGQTPLEIASSHAPKSKSWTR